MDEINAAFAPLAVEPEPARIIRGVGMAVAQDWEVRIPQGTLKPKALDLLRQAVEMACAAVAS